MSPVSCKCCGLDEVEIDATRGASVCIACGAVLEESAIISDVQFEENAHGVSSAVGQFVSADSSGANIRKLGKFYRPTTQKENREATILRVKRTMLFIGKQLKIEDHVVEEAVNFYKMALSRSITRGRKSFLIYATCLYCVCRLERTPHLLIDFCDLLQLNIFALGRTCDVLTRALSLSLPYTDPCIYLLRYASQLNFNDKTHDVYVMALRILKRMKRDSLHYGRVPAGLCGAALLLAARHHNFNRDLKDVVRVVRIHETTLKKRLQEFGLTPSSTMTADEFLKNDLEADQDPPSFRASHLADIQHIDGSSKEYRKKLRLLETIIDKYVDRRKLFRKNLDDHIIDGVLRKEHEFDIDDGGGGDDSSSECDDPDTEEDIDIEEEEQVSTAPKKRGRCSVGGSGKPDDKNKSPNKSGKSKLTAVIRGKKLLKNATGGGVAAKKKGEVEQIDVNAAKRILESSADALESSCNDSDDSDNDSISSLQDEWKRADNIGLEPSAETLGFGTLVDNYTPSFTTTATTTTKVNEENLNIVPAEGISMVIDSSTLNEEEIPMYTVNDSERGMKTKLWTETYAVYLQQKKTKDELKAKEEADAKVNDASSSKTSSKPRKKRATPAGSGNINELSGPSEIVEQALKAKKVSNKLNYEVLKTLDLPDFADWEQKHNKKIADAEEARADARRKKREQKNLSSTVGDKNNTAAAKKMKPSKNNEISSSNIKQRNGKNRQNSRSVVGNSSSNKQKNLNKRKEIMTTNNDAKRNNIDQERRPNRNKAKKKLKKSQLATGSNTFVTGKEEPAATRVDNDSDLLSTIPSTSTVGTESSSSQREPIIDDQVKKNDVEDDDELLTDMSSDEQALNSNGTCMSSVMELMRQKSSPYNNDVMYDDTESYYSDF